MISSILKFPVVIGRNAELGDYVHQQELHPQQVRIHLEEAGFFEIDVYTRLVGTIWGQLFFDNSFVRSRFADSGHVLAARAIKQIGHGVHTGRR